MVRTTEDLGRRGGVCAEESAVEIPPMIDRARKLFASLSSRLEAMIDRFETAIEFETDKARIRDLTELVRMNQKALQTVLDEERKLPDAAKAGRGEGVIDLAEARAEVARRLDRLAG